MSGPGDTKTYDANGVMAAVYDTTLRALRISGTGASGAPTDASYVTMVTESGLSNESVLGTAVIMSGTLGARPSAATAGRLYAATDNSILYRDTGSAWSAIADLGVTTALTSAHLLVGNASNIATDTAVTGDVTITNAGVTAIASSVALAGSPTTTTQTAFDGSTKIATTAYVDNAFGSLDVKPDVAYASTSALPANTYANGSSGVGATLTGNANGPLIIDGVTLVVGQAGERVLVAGEAAPANNGWYTITQVGVVAVSKYILTRATESDQAAEIGAGYLTGVVAPNTVVPGTSNNGKVFISIAADPFTVGTTSLTFSQVGGTYSAGNGLTLSGSTFTIDTAITVDKTTAQTLTNKTINASQLVNASLDLTTKVTGALPIANGGTAGITATAAKTNLTVGYSTRLYANSILR